MNINIKAMFHQKQGSRWVPNANEIDTNNMKCTYPNANPTLAYPTQTIFHCSPVSVCDLLERSKYVMIWSFLFEKSNNKVLTMSVKLKQSTVFSYSILNSDFIILLLKH